MNNSLTICFIDIDGTIANVGDRFTSNPPPSIKDRRDLIYQQWLLSIQTPELLAKDVPVRGTQHLVGAFERSVYLTSRSEIHKVDTLKWLATHNYPVRQLIMRSKKDVSGYAEFKENAIMHHLRNLAQIDGSDVSAYNVIVIDDDSKGKLEAICKKRGWTMLKALSGGEVL